MKKSPFKLMLEASGIGDAGGTLKIPRSAGYSAGLMRDRQLGTMSVRILPRPGGPKPVPRKIARQPAAFKQAAKPAPAELESDKSKRWPRFASGFNVFGK